MNKLNKTRKFMKNFFLSRFFRLTAFALLIVLLLQSLFVFRVYKQAEAHLEENDPRKLQNRSETIFYFAPWLLKRGSSVSREEIVDAFE